jgi:hypothetical protein
MGAKRRSGPAQRRRGEPGRPSPRRGPDPAEIAEEYLDDGLLAAKAAEEDDEEIEEIPSGTVVDQKVYENLEANRVASSTDIARDAASGRKHRKKTSARRRR